jgi:Family of unknown function (DUF6163)
MHTAEPAEVANAEPWTARFVLFLRVMAALSMIKGLYHWSLVVGIGQPAGWSFEGNTLAWDAATIYFAVIDLIAAVGLWLAAAWGGVVWLTAAISMAAVELFFPQVYGGRVWVIVAELVVIVAYFSLTIAAGREQPE